MADPGSFLDPSSWPMWMQTGMQQSPPEGMTPFPAMGSGRKQRLPLPFDNGGGIEGWQDLTPAHAAAAATMIPGIGGLVGRGVAAAPKTIASMLAAGGILGATSQAGQAADQVDPIQGEIDAINARLGKNNDEVVRLGTTMTKSPKGTQASAIDTLKGTISADQARLQVLQGQFADRAEQQRLEAEAKRGREAPFQERFAPYSYAAPFVGPAFAMATNYGLGRFLGAGRANAVNAWEAANKAASTQFAKKGGIDNFKGQALAGELAARQAKGLPLGNSPLLTGAAAGGIAGGLEGAAVPYFTNEYDAQTLPPGSPNQVAAQNAVKDPNWWLSKVALPSGMGALAGAFGGYRGVKAKGPYADPGPKTAGLLAALEAQAAQKAAGAQSGRQVLPGMSNVAPGVPPALGPAAWYARQLGR